MEQTHRAVCRVTITISSKEYVLFKKDSAGDAECCLYVDNVDLLDVTLGVERALGESVECQWFAYVRDADCDTLADYERDHLPYFNNADVFGGQSSIAYTSYMSKGYIHYCTVPLDRVRDELSKHEELPLRIHFLVTDDEVPCEYFIANEILASVYIGALSLDNVKLKIFDYVPGCREIRYYHR